MKTTKASDIKQQWHIVDVKGKVLGRTAVYIARLLMGKQKPYYVAHLDCGDYVVVTNAKEVFVTGKKEMQKKFYRHSGYPGGLRVETFDKLKARKPQDVIIHAVRGMLPQNKLRDRRLKRLFVFAGEEHPYQDKLKTQNSKLKT
ncbi:50S ribosomal protein L13 [Candidatus Microgenomates bacterium]|nr:50S ribosomal protein L13 [Candidatus Microgenomates bacterium]